MSASKNGHGEVVRLARAWCSSGSAEGRWVVCFNESK